MAATNPPAPEISPKMFLVPAVMLSLRFLKIDFSEYVVYLRISYLFGTLSSVAIYCYMMQLAKSKDDKTKVEVVEKVPTTGAETRRIITVAQYDSEEAFKKIKSLAFGMCVVGFIHLKWGSPMPLLLQSFMAWVNLSDDPLVKIHFFNKPAEGKLKRPFKVHNPLADLMGASDTAPPAEKSTAATKKSD